MQLKADNEKLKADNLKLKEDIEKLKAEKLKAKAERNKQWAETWAELQYKAQLILVGMSGVRLVRCMGMFRPVVPAVPSAPRIVAGACCDGPRAKAGSQRLAHVVCLFSWRPHKLASRRPEVSLGLACVGLTCALLYDVSAKGARGCCDTSPRCAGNPRLTHYEVLVYTHISVSILQGDSVHAIIVAFWFLW